MVYIYQVAWSSSMWLQAKHLHTSAESSVSPAASLSSPEVLSDLFTCSPHFTQAKRAMGHKGRENGEKEERRKKDRWRTGDESRGEGRERRQ